MHHLRQTVGVDTTLAVNPHIQRLREAYPGIYLPGRRSLRQLNKMLAAYFAVPIKITPRYAKWIDDGKKRQPKAGQAGSTRIGSRFSMPSTARIFKSGRWGPALSAVSARQPAAAGAGEHLP